MNGYHIVHIDQMSTEYRVNKVLNVVLNNSCFSAQDYRQLAMLGIPINKYLYDHYSKMLNMEVLAIGMRGIFKLIKEKKIMYSDLYDVLKGIIFKGPIYN